MKPIRSLLAVLLLASVAFADDAKHATVSPDGSGDFKTIQSAVDAAPSNSNTSYEIDVKPGTYNERITIPAEKTHLILHGQDADASKTILTWGWSANHEEDGKKIGTFKSYSTAVYAPDFLAENISFENSAGNTGQALALAAVGDRQIYRNCRLLGWQDTLYANSGRQYYDHCYIEGRVDFIFGNAVAVFDHCEIKSKNGGHITAARTDQSVPWGYVFLDCKLTGDPTPWEAPNAAPSTKPASTRPVQADLGRPWRPYASVTYVRCELGDHIKPAGWQTWRAGDPATPTARYAEYKNTGPGADISHRVPWSRQLTDDQAAQLTVSNILAGTDHWNPAADSSSPGATQP